MLYKRFSSMILCGVFGFFNVSAMDKEQNSSIRPHLRSQSVPIIKEELLFSESDSDLDSEEKIYFEGKLLDREQSLFLDSSEDDPICSEFSEKTFNSESTFDFEDEKSDSSDSDDENNLSYDADIENNNCYKKDQHDFEYILPKMFTSVLPNYKQYIDVDFDCDTNKVGFLALFCSILDTYKFYSKEKIKSYLSKVYDEDAKSVIRFISVSRDRFLEIHEPLFAEASILAFRDGEQISYEYLCCAFHNFLNL